MADLKIKGESLPERCEVCHQADLFDPKTGYCARCAGVDKAPLLKQPRSAGFRKLTYPFAQIRISDLWLWEGNVGRAQYLLVGVTLFAIKRILDGFVTVVLFHRPWSLFNYIVPYILLSNESPRENLPPENNLPFYLTLLTISLPFIWAGIVLTIRRLRAAQLPIWLVSLFFVPVLNLLFFLLLSILPTRQETPREGGSPRPTGRFGRFLERAIPDGQFASAAMALLLTLFPAILAVQFSVLTLREYGWSLFFLLPFCLGLGSSLLHGYRYHRSYWSCIGVSLLSFLMLGVAMVGLAIEGIFCLVMAAPIGAVLAIIGGSIGYAIQRRPLSNNVSSALLLILLLLVPALMGAEYKSAPQPPLFAVRTAVDVDASPEQVWQQVISFPEIPSPDYWLFRIGIAYPTQAKIDGRGVGAVRHCIFSTGSFVEPIEVWNEPNLLKFFVASQPLPMQEWTPYAGLHPPHLDDYLVSRAGQFSLTPLPGGRTRLEGTTWYQQNIWPAAYWQLWSDFIIHRIHLRVLNHIKRLCEQQSPPIKR